MVCGVKANVDVLPLATAGTAETVHKQARTYPSPAKGKDGSGAATNAVCSVYIAAHSEVKNCIKCTGHFCLKS